MHNFASKESPDALKNMIQTNEFRITRSLAKDMPTDTFWKWKECLSEYLVMYQTVIWNLFETKIIQATRKSINIW